MVSRVYDDESLADDKLWDVYRAAAGVEDGLDVKYGCLSFVGVPKGEVGRKWVEDSRDIRALLRGEDYHSN